MLKRPNEGMGRGDFASTSEGAGNDVVEKRRKIQFEPVRMPAVSNVNDMKGRAAIYQGAKLKQTVIFKNKKIVELEKDLDRARRRQHTDEMNFMRVYNLFSEIVQLVCTQTRNEFGEYPGYEPAPSGTIVQGHSSDQALKFADEMKAHLRNAFASYAKARQDRASEASRFISKVKTFLEDPNNRIDSINKELTARVTELTLQNEKMQAEVTKAQTDAYNSDRKRRTMQDKVDMIENRKSELEKLVDEATYEMERQMKLAAKFENRLMNAAAEFEAKGAAAAAETSSGADGTPSQFEATKNMSPATPPTEQSLKELDTLRSERDELVQLSAKRLTEIEGLEARNQEQAAEICKLTAEIKSRPHLSTEAIHNTEEYKNLRKYYCLAFKEFERASKDLEEACTERDRLRVIGDQRYKSVCEEQAKTLAEIQAQSEVHNQFYKIMHDNEILRAEFETVQLEHSKTVKQAQWDELKSTINTLRSVNSTLKSDIMRQKDKTKHASQEVQNLKSEMEKMKKMQERSLLLPLEEHGGYVMPEDYNRMKQEYDALRKEVKRLGAQEKEKDAERIKKEVERQLGAKNAELETLRRTNETLENDEQCISDELESIGTAVEEMQERNSLLVREKREQEDRNLKMMNDRMVQNQVQSRMREKIEALEKKSDVETQLSKMAEFQKKGLEEQNNKFTEMLQFKTAELTRVTNSLEVHRKNLAEIAMARDEFQMKVERNEIQVTNLKDMYTAKSKEVEDLRYKRARLEEDLEMMKSKYERVKRNESSGGPGGDQVLEEANRQMKETLTCPSCKTRPKDCIMLKCYHLFCETCIKTMYDTRQRKCPKCNSNFGANDFHRVFI